MKLPPGNRAALKAGTRHHARKAAAEQVAGATISLGWFLAAVATLTLLLLLWWRL